ncbi:MAG: M1 family metallopeptidase [Bacteroidota bacterium]
MNRLFVFLALLAMVTQIELNAQPDRWQQGVEYKMNIDFNVDKHQYKGTQELVYHNNSPDALDRVFYHLYFNAFQPGSMMDVRSRTLPDPDGRVGSRISKLQPNEIGYIKVKSLKHNGKKVSYEVVGTILEVQLKKPIPPNSSARLEMEFEAQVPVQIRRSGRDNKEGISYSMSQWYPKLCEYDYQGWHANPYVGREFYGVWGSFDVNINIDKRYIVGATGELKNAGAVGYGYERQSTTVNRPGGDKLKWNFYGENIHDFVWAADPDYTHTSLQAKDGPLMHFLYQENDRTVANWKMLPTVMDRAFAIINERFGEYPYPVYSFIQGGDGGMEYPMATLITGERNFASLVGVSVHELMHSWYQMVLGTNESLYAWMDEGFTSYATNIVVNELKREGLIPGSSAVSNPQAGSYMGYSNLTQSGREEPLTTHADHFSTNGAYGLGSYIKGAVFLHQLEYVVGRKAFQKGMLDYFDTWKFKHPNINDFIRVMEKTSGLELDWYKEYWINTTHTIDYGIKSADKEARKKVKVVLEKSGTIPMPIDLVVTMKDGSKKIYNIPLRIMRGSKEQEYTGTSYEVLEDWPWTHPSYEVTLKLKWKNIEKIEIDPSSRMADINISNNIKETEVKP